MGEVRGRATNKLSTSGLTHLKFPPSEWRPGQSSVRTLKDFFLIKFQLQTAMKRLLLFLCPHSSTRVFLLVHGLYVGKTLVWQSC